MRIALRYSDYMKTYLHDNHILINGIKFDELINAKFNTITVEDRHR